MDEPVDKGRAHLGFFFQEATTLILLFPADGFDSSLVSPPFIPYSCLWTGKFLGLFKLHTEVC